MGIRSQSRISSRRGTERNGLLALLTIALAVVLPSTPGDALGAGSRRVTVQDFDRPGDAYAVSQCAELPAPEIVPEGPWGSYLRLATDEVPNQNAIAFDRLKVGVADTVVADFDMRISPSPPGRADGVGFALLDTAEFGTSGAVCPPGDAEEPAFAGSLGVGFDVYQNGATGDLGNDVIRENFSNSVSVHFDGRLLHQVDVSPYVDLGGGQWLHARVIVRPGAGFSTVSVLLTPFAGRPVAVVSDLQIDGLASRDVRAFFAARSGGQSARFDLDNVRVTALGANESAFSFESPWSFVDETTGRAAVAVTRVGNITRRAKVRYVVDEGTATAGADYRRRSGTLKFAPGEMTKLVEVEIEDDGDAEEDETLRVRLEPAPVRSRAAGPSSVEVTIYDDETARVRGRWDAPRWWPVVAVHASLLPTGKVLFWDRFGVCYRWDPVTDAVEETAQPPFNVFCSGQSFLGDGRLLVAGGHLHDGSPEHDGVGIAHAALYDPLADAWESLPDMNGGRWYPTNTTLADGDVLVSSGSVDGALNPNDVSQIWEADTFGWRDLDGAREREPYGVDLYPRMFLAPDGRVFKAGPDRGSWFLDVTGRGTWSRGPVGVYPRARTYGPAVMYRPGKVLVAGGSNPPTETAEVIDLNDRSPEWRAVESMAFARRHGNLTLLPDGTVLATGGTSGPGTNNQTTPVLAAELWDPEGESWSLLPSARIPRLYHSVSMLLPDGRVLSAGGGQGDGASENHSNAEIYWPAYLFKGPRPAIEEAPSEVRYGERFVVRSGDSARVARVTLVRLPSVTHAFDQNQRWLELELTREGDGLVVTAPALADECPAGQYMLFLVDDAGVPSIARIVSVRG